MADIDDEANLRRLVISGAPVACAAWAVIGHGVLHVLPKEAPILVLLALVSIQWRDGGRAALGFARPKSRRPVVLLAAGVLDSGVADLILGGVYLLSGRGPWTCILARGLIDTTGVLLLFFGLAD